MAQFTLNSKIIADKMNRKLEASLNKFNRQLMKQIGTAFDKGGIWPYDYNRRKSQTHTHSVYMWRKYRPNQGELKYVYRNDAQNKYGQRYSKYLKGSPYKSPNLTKEQWTAFVASQRKKLKRIVKDNV